MFRKGSSTQSETYKGRHRKEHWYRDNTVYFLTTRCVNKFPAFKSPEAQSIFWNQFKKYAVEYQFDIWICTLMNNHYHAVGYLQRGANLSPMIRKIHGSIAKLVNDLLARRLSPFWDDYFDGCLRDEGQFCRAYRYTQQQSVRAQLCQDCGDYPNTHVSVSLHDGLRMALERRVFPRNVPYKRYEGPAD